MLKEFKLLNLERRQGIIYMVNPLCLGLNLFKKSRSPQRGAVLIESAFSLILLMALAAVFWETVYVMLSHQRTTYAAYIAERSRVVGGDAILAGTMVGGGIVEPSSDGTRVWEQLDLPLGLNFLWAAGGTHGIGDKHPIVERTVTLPTEPEDTGDNAYMPVYIEGDLMAYQELPVPIGGFAGLPGTDDAGRIVAGTPSPSGSGPSGTVTKEAHPIGGGSGSGGGGLYPGIPGYGDDGSGNGGNPNSCPANEPGSDGHGETRGVGNPIDVTNGNKYQREVDIRYSGDVYEGVNDQGVLPQAQGQSYSTQLPILFSRHYNSIYEVVGVLGGGWRHGYEVSLHVKGNRLPVEQDNLLLLQQGDGRWIRFERTQINQNQLIYRAESRDDGWLSVDNAHYRWYWRDGRELLFDAQGRLLRISAPNGDTQQLYYDEHHRLMSVEDSYGREFNLSYNNKGLLAQIKASDGEVVKYRYSETSQLTNVEYADNAMKVYHYEDQRDQYNLTGITDERGIRFSRYDYDNKDRAVMSTRANNVGKVSLSFNVNQHTEVTDSLGRQSTYTWKELGLNRLITEVKGPGCSSCGQGDTTITYNAHQQTIKKTTRSGITHKYDYDELGRRTEIKQHSRTNQERLIAKYNYIATEQLTYSPLDTLPTQMQRPSVKEGEFQAHAFVYNVDGQLTGVTEKGFRPTLIDTNKLDQISYVPIERATRFQYSKRGQLIQIDGPREDVKDITSFKYYAVQKKGVLDKGRLHQVIDANGDITYQINDYDQAGRVLEEQRYGLMSTQYKYDKRGRLIKNQKGEQVSQLNYTLSGQIKRRTNPDGTQVNYDYDEANRSIGSISHDGEISIRTLNTENNVLNTQLISKDGEVLRQSSFAYDAYDQRIETKDAEGVMIQRNTFDQNDLLSEVGDGNGHATQYAYDEWNRRVTTIRADNSRIGNGYDAQNRLISVIDPRQNETHYTIDDFGLRTAQLSVDTGTNQYHYDITGNLIEKINASGISISYDYDALNRKQTKTQPEGKTQYQYNEHNQLVEVNGIHSTEKYAYDTYGRKADHTREIEQHAFSTRYAYNNKTGQLKSKTLPDGQKLDYKYYRFGHEKGRLKSLQLLNGKKDHAIIKKAYYDHTYQRGYIAGNGINTFYQFNQNGQLVTISAGDLLNLSYQHDGRGNMIAIDENQETKRYTYDEIDRLVQGNDEFYNYDSVGNRTGKETEQDKYDYSLSPLTQGNQLLTLSGVSYQYDSRGNPTKIGDKRYGYDSENHRISYSDDKMDITYDYNHRDERIVISNDVGEKRIYLYEKGRLVSEYDPSQNSWLHYIFYAAMPIAQLEDKDIIYLHVNNVAMPQLATDKNQKIVWKIDNQPFGHKDKAVERVKLRFAGQYYNEWTGDYYNYHRDYDPNTGRYYTADPIGIQGGLNVYAYVENNPLMLVDPNGLSPEATPDFSPCAYYDGVAQSNGCKYHAAAGNICRGEGSLGRLVNILLATCGATVADKNCLRNCLVRYDIAARQNPSCQTGAAEQCGGTGCTKKSCIDGYHQMCFSQFECDIGKPFGIFGPSCYGGDHYPYYPNDGG